MAATIYEIPTALELRRAEQVKLPELTMGSPIFGHFPIESVEEFLLRWTQKDNFQGLQGVRGLGGKPGRVSLVGDKTYMSQPGVYGEFVPLDEVTLTLRRNAAELSGKPIPIRDLVGEAQDLLLSRRISRIKYILWTLVTSGTFSVSDLNGTVIHTDSFTLNTKTCAVPWSTHATATPMQDMLDALLLYRGMSVRADESAKIYLNRKWANHVLMNSNSADLGGKKYAGGATLNTLADINNIFLLNGLPSLEIVEEGYYDTNGTWQLFCPDNVAVMIARRSSGAKIGSYRMTLNQATASNIVGPYTAVIYHKEEIPASIEVHDGHNGGPTLEFPGAIVKFSC